MTFNTILNINRKKRKTILKILGLTIFSKEIDKAETVFKIKLLLGLLYVKYDIFFRTFNFNLCGLTILRTKLSGSYRILYFLFLPILFENVNKKSLSYFLDSVIDKYPQYDDYYVILSRSGEFFLLMHHFKEWLKMNNSKNFILIFTARYHLNICKMFFPDIPMAYVKKANVPLISRGVKSIHSVYKTKNIYVPTNEKYFVQVENDIRNKNGHYYELLKQHLNLSGQTGKYTISLEAQNKIKNIVKYILNDNFVFISPETLSNEPMEKDFWDNLTAKLKSLGYEVFCNAMEFKNLADDSTSTFLTYEESIELAKYAKAIIGMRSGFLECLSQNNVPLVALYTDFPERPGFKRLKSDKVLSGFSIAELPNVNKDLLFEYDVSAFTNEDEIIESILLNIFDKKQEEVK